VIAVVVVATSGNTIHHIAAVRLMVIEALPTGSVELRVAIHWATGNGPRNETLAARAATSAALTVAVLATVEVSAIEAASVIAAARGIAAASVTVEASAIAAARGIAVELETAVAPVIAAAPGIAAEQVIAPE
jgi:hypothetical protein